jgi:hypothetical protein
VSWSGAAPAPAPPGVPQHLAGLYLPH